ncbi:MAG: hypothetical protein WCJ72_09020 [Chryseobacterium sp.]
MYYKDQTKLSEKEWMESVMSQMGFKTINEDPAPYQNQGAIEPQEYTPKKMKPRYVMPKTDPIVEASEKCSSIMKILAKSKSDDHWPLPTDIYDLSSLLSNIKGMFQLLPNLKIEVDEKYKEASSIAQKKNIEYQANKQKQLDAEEEPRTPW